MKCAHALKWQSENKKMWNAVNAAIEKAPFETPKGQFKGDKFFCRIYSIVFFI